LIGPFFIFIQKKMIKVFINSEAAYVPFNSTVLEACESVGIEVPRFCFHERLSVAGNCRMCLVEIEKTPKPVASCAMPVMNNMQVFTDTPLVKKAREGVLEFLLLNHPLDCPICDQGGECDLQDQAMFFGTDKSRFFEDKRGVEDKNCGPLIKTIMTRCIHCTRCVRFAADIAGVEDLGTTNRGRDTEVGTYVSKVFQSELSGNVIDLCPVGALTSKPYAFIARPWELRSTETIDISDAVGSNIRVDFKETEIVRVLPRLNEDINEEWISDKSRFNFDSLKKQRLDSPYLRKNESLQPCSWEIAIEGLKGLLSVTQASKTSILCSVNSDIKTLESVKTLAGNLGIQNIGYPRDLDINTDFSENFLCNTSLGNIAEADFCLLVGTNPRYEASMLNLKLRKRFRRGLFKVASVGIPHNLTYSTEVLGISPKTLVDIAEGKHSLCKDLRKAKKPIVLYGASLAERKDFSG
jgi:NADH dehydrogenase (ubiquinone) Fe-S protein 1